MRKEKHEGYHATAGQVPRHNQTVTAVVALAAENQDANSPGAWKIFEQGVGDPATG